MISNKRIKAIVKDVLIVYSYTPIQSKSELQKSPHSWTMMHEVRSESNQLPNPISLLQNFLSTKVVNSGWLTECLRADSLQPIGSHLLGTVSAENLETFAKKSTGAASASKRSSAGGEGVYF